MWNDIRKSGFFDLFILATDVFIMPVMFLIAGYFALPALLTKGTGGFWRDKLWRIVLPWVFGVLVIAPAVAYSAVFSRTSAPPGYVSFWINDFFGRYYQQAHYWFLGILALFFALLIVAYRLTPAYFARRPAVNNPPVRFFPLFALLSAAPFFFANLFFWSDAWVNCKYLFMIQPVRIGLYFCYFGLGVYAWKNAWFDGDGYRPSLLYWGPAAALMLVVFLAYRVAFTLTADIPVMFKAGHALVYANFCLSAAMALIALFARAAGSDASLWRGLAANSYAIYYVHQCIVIPLAYMVRKLPVNIWLKYFSVAACAVVLCYFVAKYCINPFFITGKRTAGL
ncbi:acyltransferase family protein [Anaeroselena agilis]|uniref:Acyltransferase family protein n=1 Tax=Anaeroselena agilis TaxID=3063788 RepID=A0ABU3P1Z6_9FIRM|nr:acyltransferase family protein [Selenomonadales bacterium 4137-cl]